MTEQVTGLTNGRSQSSSTSRFLDLPNTYSSDKVRIITCTLLESNCIETSSILIKFLLNEAVVNNILCLAGMTINKFFRCWSLHIQCAYNEEHVSGNTGTIMYITFVD